jgi:hypothetical protein
MISEPNRSLPALLAGSALLIGIAFSANVSAAFVTCGSNPAYAPLTTKVDPNVGCGVLEPLGANQNDVPQPGFVNDNAFFAITDWLFSEKYTESKRLIEFASAGRWQQSGTFSAVNGAEEFLNSLASLMFVFKDGGNTNLVSYLIDPSILGGGGSGTYSSPFVEPPFTFPGAGPRDISHISVYYRLGEGPRPPEPPLQVPAPAPLALIGMGLLALFGRRGFGSFFKRMMRG